MICPRCNNNIPDGLKFCSECGAPLITQPTPQYNSVPQQQYDPQYNPPPQQQYAPQYSIPGPSGEAYATTALRFGIVGTCLDLTVFLSIVGLILGIVGIKKAGNASRMGVRSGKQKAGLILSIISLVLSLVIPFVFFASCVNRAKKNTNTAITANADDLAEKIQGTYVGSNGSVLILRKDKIGYYYYPNYGVSTNSWKITDNKLEMFISNTLSEVFAEIDPNNTDTLYLDSESILWDAETFTKVSTDSTKLSEEQCDTLLAENSSLVVNKPKSSSSSGTTTTTVGTTTASTTQAVSNSSSQSTTVDDMTVKDALDKYEEYMDKYIELYQGMMDGSLNYFEAYSELTELQEDVDELETALNSLSESDMTAEDYQYYIEVMNRVNEKVLSMYG